MKLKPEEKKHNPHRKDRMISFRVNAEDLLYLEILRRENPEMSDGSIVRALIKAGAESSSKTKKR